MRIPPVFCSRPCDRQLSMALARDCGIHRAEARGLMLGLWQNHSMDPVTGIRLAADVSSYAVVEDFCGWRGNPGTLISTAASSAFLIREDMPGGFPAYVPYGFSEANPPEKARRTFGREGGLAKSVNSALRKAEGDASTLMEFFRRHDAGFLTSCSPAELRTAMVFIEQINRIMRWPSRQDASFMTVCVAKAIPTLASLGSHRDTFLAWLALHREHHDTPQRIDTLLDQTPSMLSKALEWKARD